MSTQVTEFQMANFELRVVFASSVVERQVFLQQRSVKSAKVLQISIVMTVTGGVGVLRDFFLFICTF